MFCGGTSVFFPMQSAFGYVCVHEGERFLDGWIGEYWTRLDGTGRDCISLEDERIVRSFVYIVLSCFLWSLKSLS